MEQQLEKIKEYYNNTNEIIISDVGPTYQAGTLIGKFSNPYLETNLFQAKRAGIMPGMRILDAGCGAGGPAIDIAKHYSDVSIEGITISEQQATYGKKLVGEENLTDRINIQVGDFHELPFEDNSFDLIYFFESSLYSYDLEKLLFEVARCLKKGGIVYIKDIIMVEKEFSEIEKIALKEFNEVYALSRNYFASDWFKALVNTRFTKVDYEDLVPYIGTYDANKSMVKHVNGVPQIGENKQFELSDFGKVHVHQHSKYVPSYFGDFKGVKWDREV